MWVVARASQCRALKGFALVRSTFGPSPQSANSSEKRQSVLDHLRQRIRQIENNTPQFNVPPRTDLRARVHHHISPDVHDTFAAGSPSGLPVEDGGISPRNARTPMSSSSPLVLPHIQTGSRPPAGAWTLGDRSLNHLVGPHGLEADAVHELKANLTGDGDDQGRPHWAARWSAARRFLLALIIRRFAALDVPTPTSPPGILWCWPRVMAQEFGDLYAPGLDASLSGALGTASRAITIVEPSRSQDVLWAMEEGLKSKALACVVGVLDDVDLTPARRLALAAQKYNVPALVLTSPRAPPMAATATRWRIAPMPSAQHPIETNLPGSWRLKLSLERRRSHPVPASAAEVTVDWCVREGSFHLADAAGPGIRQASALPQRVTTRAAS